MRKNIPELVSREISRFQFRDLFRLQALLVFGFPVTGFTSPQVCRFALRDRKLYLLFEQSVLIAVVIQISHSSQLQPGLGIALRVELHHLETV